MRFLTLILVVFFMTAGAQIIMPPIEIWPLYPSITFSESSDRPAVSGSPACIDTVELAYSCTCASVIATAEIRGDSLIFGLGTAIDDPIPLDSAVTNAPIIIGNRGYKIVFDKAGVYKAYERQAIYCFVPPCPEILVYRGSFRILPKIKTTPSVITTRDSFNLQLILGQSTGSCVYRSNYRIADSAIYLGYSCTNMFRLVIDAGLVPYGPDFNLGKLAAGNYQIMVEDSVNIGMITVNDIIVVNGEVLLMINPLLDMIAPRIPAVEIIAFPAQQCDWWYSPMAEPETLRTVSDASGNFTLNIPSTGQDWEITALGRGYHPQTMYLNNYPLSKSLPPQVNLSYELIGTADSAIGGCVITVTNSRGAPVESAYVSIAGGREPLICPLLLKAAAGTTSFYGYTDRQGRFSVKGASLDPYIDYAVSIYKDMQSAQGLIRLNRFMSLSFSFALGGTGAEVSGLAKPAGYLEATPNPFNPLVTVRFANPGRKADISIYGVDGKQVKSFENVRGAEVSWNAQGLPAGMYVLRAKINGLILTRKLILAK